MEKSKDQPGDEPQGSGVKKAHLLVPRCQASKSERNNGGKIAPEVNQRRNPERRAVPMSGPMARHPGRIKEKLVK